MSKIDSDDVKFGKVISEEVSAQLKDSIDLLSASIPIGEICPIMTNIPGVDNPNPDIWQECVGDEITNPNSPLRSIGGIQRFTPDMRERYLKVPAVAGNAGVPFGLNDNYIFRHNHGGFTGTHTSPSDVEKGGNRSSSDLHHNHVVNYSFDYPVNVEPPFYTLKWFMRIQ